MGEQKINEEEVKEPAKEAKKEELKTKKKEMGLDIAFLMMIRHIQVLYPEDITKMEVKF